MNLSSRAALLFSSALAVSAVLAAEPFASTYQVPLNAPVLIQGATVLTGSGERLEAADVLISDGKIQAIGKGLAAPAGARIIDAHGKWVTPGIIDIHSHLGVYASPSVKGLDDGNEMTNPVTSNVWA
jgi:imidazolonepropionase-like amidohydrolase